MRIFTKKAAPDEFTEYLLQINIQLLIRDEDVDSKIVPLPHDEFI
jgi:hypothetical protein